MFCLEPVGKRPKGAAPYTTLVPRGEDRPYFVGRVEETCAIHIDHHDVSRKHASLEVTTFQSFLNENPGARHYFTLWRESREQEQQQQQQQEGHDVVDIVGGGDSGEESGGSGVVDMLVEELLLSPLLRIRNLSRFGTKIQVIPNFHSDQATPESEEQDGGARSFVLRDSEGEHVEHNNFGSNLSLKDASMLNNSYGAAGSNDNNGVHGKEEEVVPRYVYIPSVTHDQYILSFGQSAHFKVSFRPIVASIATLHYTPEYVFELTQMFRQLGCTILDGGLPQPQVQRINYAEVFLRVNEDEDLMFAIHNEAAAVMATETAVTMMGAVPLSFVDHSPHPKRSQEEELEMAGVEGLVEPSTSPIREVSRGRSAGAIDHPNEDGLVEDESGVVSLRDLAGGGGGSEVDPRDKERIRLERAHARREVESRVILQTKLVEFFADQLQEVLLRPLSLIHVCDEIDDSVSTLQALSIGYMIALPAYVFELFALVAENPIRPLHVLPHPFVGSGGASAEPLRKRAVYGSAPYVHSVPTSCPISLHPIPESSTAPRTRRELFRDRCIYLPTIPLQRKNGAAVALGGGRVVTYTEPPSAKADFKAKLEASQLAEHQRQLKEEEEATRRNMQEGGETDGTESDADAAARRSTASSSFYHHHNDVAAPTTVTSFVAGTAAATQQALMLTNNCIIDVDEDGDLPLGALYVGKYVVVSEVLEQQVKELYLYAQDMYAQYQRYPLATILNSTEALNQVIYEPSVVAELKDVLLAVHRGWMPVAERSVHVSLLSNAFVLHSSVVEEIVIMAVEEQQQLGLHIKGMESTGADMVQNEIESQRRRDMLVRVFGATLANDDSTVRDMLLQEHNDALFAQLSEDKARKYGVMAEEVMLAAPNRLGGGLMRSTGNMNSSLRVMEEQNNGGNLGGFVAANRHADTYESVFNPDGRMMRRSMPVVDRGGEGVGGLTPTDSLGTRNTPGAFPKEDLKKGIPLGLLKGRLNPFHRNKHFDPLLDGANTATSKRLGDEAVSYNNGEYYDEGEEDIDSDATPSSIDSDEHNLNHKRVPEGRFTRELKLYNEGNEYKRLVLLAYNNSQNVLLRESAKLRALHANVLASAQRRETQRHQQLQHNSSMLFSPRTPRGGNSKQPQQSSLSGQSVSWLHALLAQHCTPQLELLERLALYKESRNPTINDDIEGELLLGPKGGVTSSSPHRRMANNNKDATGGFSINCSNTISNRTRGLYNSNLKAADGGGDQQRNWMDGERREKGTGLLLETLWDEAEEIRILGEACLSQHAREVGYVTTDGGYVAPLRYESDFARQVDEILNSEAALGIKSLDTVNTQSSLRRMRGGALSSSSRHNNSKASPASRASPKRTNTPSKQSSKQSNKQSKNASGVQRRLEVSDAAISDIQTLGTSRQLNVPSSGVSVDGNRRFALLSSHLAAVEHNNLRNNNAGDSSYNRNGSGSISAGAGASPNHGLGESSTAGLARKPIARGTALARYPPLPLFATQEIHRNPRLASAALTSPHTAGTVATGGVRNQRGGPVTQQYMGRDPTTAHLSASEALTAKLCEAVPPTDLRGVARRRVHFVKKYGRDEGEKRFTLWLGGQTPIWNREFYRSLDGNNLTLHGLFERGW